MYFLPPVFPHFVHLLSPMPKIKSFHNLAPTFLYNLINILLLFLLGPTEVTYCFCYLILSYPLCSRGTMVLLFGEPPLPFSPWYFLTYSKHIPYRAFRLGHGTFLAVVIFSPALLKYHSDLCFDDQSEPCVAGRCTISPGSQLAGVIHTMNPERWGALEIGS